MSNALVILVKTEQDCLKKLLKTVRTARRISELVRQRGQYRVETTARYNELVTICGRCGKP